MVIDLLKANQSSYHSNRSQTEFFSLPVVCLLPFRVSHRQNFCFSFVSTGYMNLIIRTDRPAKSETALRLLVFSLFLFSSPIPKVLEFSMSLIQIFFLRWIIFKVFIEFVTILLLFYVLVFWLQGMWDLSSPTRDWILTPCIGRQSLNHWTTREVPSDSILEK